VVPPDAGEVALGLLGQSAGLVLVTPGALYCRCRARTTWRAWNPSRCMHPGLDVEARVGVEDRFGEYMLMPPSASTTLAKESKLSSTVCWIGMPKSSWMASTSWFGPS